MKSVYNLRLPPELCHQIEKAAKENNISINQFISFVLTKNLAYNSAVKRLRQLFKNIRPGVAAKALSKIPNSKPLEGDEL